MVRIDDLAGRLRWEMVLKNYTDYMTVFNNFEIDYLASLNEERGILMFMQDLRALHNPRKIKAIIIHNAQN